jgi:polysaccharide biosynthesis transport protein
MYSKFHKTRQIPNGESILDGPRAGSFADLAVWHSQSTFFTESFRAAAMSLLFARVNGAGPRVIVITSSCSKEGKSTIASNLAISFARINRRTLLIDGDTRKPRLHHLFDLEGKPGLRDLLLDEEPLENIPMTRLAYPTEVENLFVLPAGDSRDGSGDLLHSNRLSKLLRRFRQEFDTVIIDTPPMGQIPDARILGRLADGVVLLVRAGVTSRDMAQTALDRLAQDGTPVFGTILNHWTPQRRQVSGYYQYYQNTA